MEVKFTNHYERNKGIIKEIYLGYYTRPFWLFLFFCLIVEFVTALALVIINAALGSDFHHLLWALVLPALCFLHVFISYNTYVSTTHKRDLEMHGKNVDIEITVTDEFIQNDTETSSAKLTYDNITSAYQTKNLILLRSKARLIYALKKDSFELGTKEEFISFLKSKGITVSGK